MDNTWVEYAVRQNGPKSWSVWMIEIAADGKTFLNSTPCSQHRTMAGADKAAASLRERDEAHISRRLVEAA